MAAEQTCPACGQQVSTDPKWRVTYFKGGQIRKFHVDNETLARGYAAGLIGKEGISGVEIEQLQGQDEPLLALKAIYDKQGVCRSAEEAKRMDLQKFLPANVVGHSGAYVERVGVERKDGGVRLAISLVVDHQAYYALLGMPPPLNKAETIAILKKVFDQPCRTLESDQPLSVTVKDGEIQSAQ